MTKVLLIILFFILPFIHGKIFPILGINLYFIVSGNFEFTKVIFFNIFSGIIFLSFFIENIILPVFLKREESKKYSNYNIYLLYIIIFLILSTLFSISPFNSLIGDTEKGHTALMFFNLLGLFIVLKNINKKFLKKLIIISLFSGISVSLLSIKELFFPSYDYGALAGRALGSFGHPNYLAGYLLLLLPFINYIQKDIYRNIMVSLFILGIVLSQSIVAIFLVLWYFSYLFIKIRTINKKILLICIFLGFIISYIFLIKFFPEKLHSFLSRFYLWETTLKIIFSNTKIFLLGGGAETLPYYFNSFKSPELYIFENYGFTADRPHNFFLNIFYHFGVFALGLCMYLVYKFLKYFKNTPENIALLLFLLFGVFHYFSITSYLLIILIFTLYSHSMVSFYKESSTEQGRIQTREVIIILAITSTSLLGAYFSVNLYRSEILYKDKNYINAQKIFPHPKYLIQLDAYKKAAVLEGILSQRNIREQIILSPKRKILCDTLILKYPSVENYFYCGNFFWNIGKQDIAKKYYNIGLAKLPSLWNPNSPYWDNYFIKNTITGNRFFSEKFGDINSILEKVGK